MAHERQEEREHKGYGGNGQYGVDERDACHLRYKAVPVALGCCRRMRERNVVERTYPRLWQAAFEHSVAGHREAYHIRCEEGGNDRHCHYYGIKEFARHLKRNTQRGNDERELTYLRHRKSASHSRLERLSAYEEAERTEHSLTYKYGQHQCSDRQGVADDDFRIDQHAHRHEEYGSEEVLHGGNKLLYLACLNGLSKDAAHNECSESRTETHLGRHYCHQAAQSERHDEQSLVVDELAR